VVTMTLRAIRIHSRGFSYLGLLFAIGFMGVGLAMAGQLWSNLDRRAKEQQLLFIGAEFSRALGRYYDGSPGPEKQFPATLEELLLDRRYPDTRRHLRKIYKDPFTGKAEWGLVRTPAGRISGVYSLAAGTPFKKANFDNGFAFEGKQSYLEWIFKYFSGTTSVATQLGDSASSQNAFNKGAAVNFSGVDTANAAATKTADAATRTDTCNATYAGEVADCEISFPDADYKRWGSQSKTNCLRGAKSMLNECLRQN